MDGPEGSPGHFKHTLQKHVKKHTKTKNTDLFAAGGTLLGDEQHIIDGRIIKLIIKKQYLKYN